MSNPDGTPISPNEVRNPHLRPVGRVEPPNYSKLEVKHIILDVFYETLMNDCLHKVDGYDDSMLMFDPVKLADALTQLIIAMKELEAK